MIAELRDLLDPLGGRGLGRGGSGRGDGGGGSGRVGWGGGGGSRWGDLGGTCPQGQPVVDDRLPLPPLARLERRAPSVPIGNYLLAGAPWGGGGGWHPRTPPLVPVPNTSESCLGNQG